MNVKQSEIEAIQQWLEPRLRAFNSHGEKVRELLRAADAPEAMIESATETVTSGFDHKSSGNA